MSISVRRAKLLEEEDFFDSVLLRDSPDNGDNNSNDTDNDNTDDEGDGGGDDDHHSRDHSSTGTGTGTPVASNTPTGTVTTSITRTSDPDHRTTDVSTLVNGSTLTSSSAGGAPTRNSNSPLDLSSSSGHLSSASIGGIVFAIAIALVLAAGAFFYLRRRNRRLRSRQLDLLSTNRDQMTQTNRNLYAPSTHRGSIDESNSSEDGHNNVAGVGAGVDAANRSDVHGIPETESEVGRGAYGYYGTGTRRPVINPLPLPARSSLMAIDDTKLPYTLIAGAGSSSSSSDGSHYEERERDAGPLYVPGMNMGQRNRTGGGVLPPY